MNRYIYIFLSFCFVCGARTVATAAPVANFSATTTTSCAPLIVQFSDLSTGSPTSWSWTLGNGITSTLQNPSTTYTTAGTYTVSLTVSNSSGTDTKTITNYITVTGAPSVGFTASDTLVACGSKTVTFTNNTVTNSTGTATYFWDFGDGYTSTAQSPPAHTYTTVGTYSVSLLVTNGAGCTKSLVKSNHITVAAKPVAGFTATNTSNCAAPITTVFTNTTTGGSTYAWDFGDGNSSTATSPTHTYSTAGSYTVRLITVSAAGCRDTVTKSAFVNVGTLTAGFTSNVTTACTNNAIFFTNTTVPGGGNSTWYFGDGTTSTAINPSHAYTTAGTYNVKLIINYSNCSDSVTHTVTINAGPTSAFTATPLVGCAAPLTVTFTNSTSGASSYAWDFGNGSTSTTSSGTFTQTYNALGTYTVRLISASLNGCKDTLTRPAYINIQTPTATLNTYPYLGCAPAAASFTPTISSLVPISSYSWNFGDASSSTSGPSVSHTYATAGTYTVTVTLTTTTGCTFTATQNVIVSTKITPSFSASPTTACYRSPITFTNTTTGTATYTWLFGDGGGNSTTSPTYVYSAPGTFNVTLITDNNGCKDTLVKSNYITINPPKANFTYVHACTARKQITFTNTSIGATSYVWNFGDGSATDTAKDPVHNYASFGGAPNYTYTVTLIATSSVTGCVDTLTSPVLVAPLFTGFTATDTVICRGSIVNFNQDNYLNSYSGYIISFGDGTSAVRTPGHTYASSGIYTVTNKVIDYLGCSDSLTKTNYIRVHAPTAFFTNTPAMGCAQLSVSFTDASFPSSGSSITSRLWSFGDGSTSTATSPTHLYLSSGTYNVTLTVTETGGCTNTYVKTNAISVMKPTAAFTLASAATCAGRSNTFTNTSAGRAPLTYAWNFGDGGTSTSATPTHTYATTGNYTVRLIVTDTSGCMDTLTRANYVGVTTVSAGFTMSDTAAPCPPAIVSFTNTSTGATAGYLWQFGNGGTANIANPSAAYTTSGTFVVKLVATNTTGCKDSATRNFVVGTGPSGTFTYTPTTGCVPISISFSATSLGATSLTYDFGNGATNTTTSTSVSYTYTAPGIYRPVLILTNSNGCSTYITGIDSIVAVKANAGFAALPTSGCVGTTVHFTDTTSVVGSTIASRAWNFGDGGTATTTNPSHTYATAGTYSVRLIATTATGCQDTTFRTVTINPIPVVSGGGNKSICAGASVSLTASGASGYVWSPATGLSATTGATVSASPGTTTTYTVSGTSAAGCSATDTVRVTVTPLPLVTVNTPAAICAGSSATLTASGASTYSWTPTTGLSAGTGASVSASPTSTTAYTVTGTSNGCPASATTTLAVNPVPTVTVTGGATICAGASATLAASGATTYSWSPSTGLSATTGTSVTASPSSTTTYTVTGTSNGCSATATAAITVTPIPVVTVSGNASACAGVSTTLTASGATSYSWSPATGLSATTGASVTANPSATMTYTVTGTTGACTGTTTKTLTINALPTVSAGGSKAICAGASATLTASGATTYAWSPTTGLSSGTGGSVTASPTATTLYTVTGTDGNGCAATDTARVTVNPLPVVSAGTAQFICPGNSTTLTASGAASYVWSPSTGLSGTTTASVTASPTATTTYKVVGTSAAGCKDSATVVVNVNSSPTVTVSGTLAVCAGGSTTLTASGANAYTWTPSATLSSGTGASVTASPTATTTYTVTGTSGVGCSGTATVTVTVNPLPTVTVATPAAICAGASASLTASGAATYAWSPATGLSATTGAGVTATPASTATYTVTGTDVNGCVDTAAVTVTVNARPTVSAGANASICPGNTTTLTATGASSYVWSPSTGLSGTTTASVTASPTATTTYKVVGTNAAGCKDSATVIVTVNGKPTITVSGTTAICTGSSTTLTASGATSYSWSPATGLSATTGASVTANPTATRTYTVTGTSGIGCTDSTTVTVTVNALPAVTVSSPSPICIGSSATITASGASTYAWTPSATLSSGTGASVTATPAATTTYTVTGTDGNGCLNTATTSLTVNPKPTVSAGSNVSICPGNSTTLAASGASTYVWSPSTGLSGTTTASVTATPTATTTYKVVGTSADGCKDSATVIVSVNATPTVAVTGTLAICNGGSTSLTASGASSYTWTPSATLSSGTGAGVTASPTATTTYTVTGTSGIGCSATTTVTVTVNPLPVVNAGPDTAVCAGGSVVLTATGATSYVWSPAAGLSSTTGASVTASLTSTTLCIITGTDANGCVGRDSVLVAVKALPVISGGANTSICPGGSATLTATGGASYVWSPSTGLSATTGASVTASPTATTTYTITGTGSNGCVNTATVQVAVNTTPAVTVSGNTSICTGANTVLTASGANTFSWSPAASLSASTGSSVTASPTATTTYTVTGTSGVGCTGTATFTLTVNPLPTVAVSGTTAICTGSSTTLTASGAATYAWSPSTGLSAATGTSVTANPTATTVYTVTGTSAAGCVNTTAVTVTVNPKPTVSAGSPTAICPGGSATLTASGATTYSWSPSTGLSATTGTTVSASPTATTTYTVTGTDGNGCSNTSTVTVTVNQTPSVAVTGTTSICAGGTTTLTASGAGTYSWSPATGLSASTGATVTATPAATTTYTITGTSGVGCTGTATVTVTVTPLPVVAVSGTTTICNGASTTLSASGATTYAWSPAASLSAASGTTVSANPTATTTYTVTGTSGVGCVGTTMVTVTINPLPTISAGANAAICPGQSTTLTATGGASYVWTPTATLSAGTGASVVATPATTTTYTVTGTGANGCTATSSVTVTVNQKPVVSISGNTAVCAGATTTLTASGAGTYAWTPGTGLSSTTSASVIVSITGTTTYKVVGTSGAGCVDSAAVTVVVNPRPVVTVSGDTTVCLRVPVQLTAAGAGTYTWTPATGLSSSTGANVTAAPPATTTYVVRGTDGNGCVDSARTTVTVLPLPNVVASADASICLATSTQLSVTGGLSYVWTPAAGLSCTTCNNPLASPAVTTAYIVTGTGANGCTASDTVNVNLYAQPPVNAGPDQTICSGQSAQLQASGAMTYAWSQDASLSCTACANPVAAPAATATYKVVGTDIHNCTDSDAVTITVIQRGAIKAGDTSAICEGESVKLYAEGGDSYTWFPAATLSCTGCPSPTATPITSTTYYVVVKQGQCFTDTLSVPVTVHPLPRVNAGPDQSIILGNTAQLEATGTNIATYSWTPGDFLSCTYCANPVVAPERDITYTVAVKSDFGCTAQDEVTVKVRCDGSQVWVPNTFTPNADGHNDFFYPHGKGVSEVTRMRIYNRWGEMMWERSAWPVNDKNNGWDGTYKGQPLKPDVFVWVIDAKCTNGETLQLKGDVTLIR